MAPRCSASSGVTAPPLGRAKTRTDLEQAHVSRLAVDVELDSLQQTGKQRRPQNGLGSIERVLDLDRGGVQSGPLEIAGGEEGASSTLRRSRLRPGPGEPTRRSLWRAVKPPGALTGTRAAGSGRYAGSPTCGRLLR